MPDPAPQIAIARQRWEMGDLAGAQALVLRVLKTEPTNSEAAMLYATTLAAQGKWEQGVFALTRAAQANPADPKLLFALGSFKSRTPDQAGAIAAFRRVSELAPNWQEWMLPLGYMLAESGKSDEGERILRRALALSPTSPELIGALAAVLTERARSEEAVALLKRGVAANPGDWPLLGSLCQTLNYVPRPDESEAHGYRVRFGQLLGAVPRPRPGQVSNVADPNRRLRIGYLSPDFRFHPVAHFIESAIEHHDRAAFEVFCYHTGTAVDETTRRIRKSADQWRHLCPVTDEALLAAIRGDGIDILVELSGHTAETRLEALAKRAAPVQVTYIGCPSSTGLAAIDYRVVDSITDPEGAEARAVEKLARLPHCFLCYRPSSDAPRPRAVRAEGPITFGSFNNLAKLSVATVGLWARVLQAVPGSRLLLKGRALNEESVRSFVCGQFETAGVSRDRVECVGETAKFRDHLAMYDRVDVALDTVPYNGTTTTCEALWMGVPVVALRGRNHASRVGASLLAAAELPELVAGEEGEFVRIAAGLAGDRGRVDELRKTLRSRVQQSSLCDGGAHTRSLELAYRAIWIEWCSLV